MQSVVERSTVCVNGGRSSVGARKRRQRADDDEKILFIQMWVWVCVRWEERRKCLTIMMIIEEALVDHTRLYDAIGPPSARLLHCMCGERQVDVVDGVG